MPLLLHYICGKFHKHFRVSLYGTLFLYTIIKINKGVMGIKYLFICIIIFLFGCVKKPDNDEVFLEDYDGVALYNARIINGLGDAPIENGVLLYNKDGIIEDIGKKGDFEIPDTYLKIDLKGYTMMPGFINAHVHQAYDEQNLRSWFHSGVTTVRDLGPQSSFDFIKVRDEFNKKFKNARIVSSTPIITTPGGYGRKVVSSVDEAIATVNDYINNGVDIVKISVESRLQGRRYNQLSLEEVKAITQTANTRGIHVAVHISWSSDIRLALDGGAKEFSHMVIDPISNELLQEILDRDIIWVPTLELWHNVSKQFNINYDTLAMNNLRRFYQA